MHKKTYTRSSNTSSFIYRNGLPFYEPERLWRPLKEQVQDFSSGLQELLVPKSDDEHHNYMPNYRRYDLQSPPSPIETKFNQRSHPFYHWSPATVREAFRHQEARNLGALVFFNSLTDTPFSAESLHLVQSKKTGKFYFTQLRSPSWEGFFNRRVQPLSLDAPNLHLQLRERLLTFIKQSHMQWWLDTGLIEDKDGILSFTDEDLLLEEILITMYRLYLTPHTIFEYVLNFPFKTSPEEIAHIELFKNHVRQRLSSFQNIFLNHILPTIRSERIEDKCLNLYTDYIQDLEAFSIFPYTPIHTHFDTTQRERIQNEILCRALDTHHLPLAFYQEKFAEFLDRSNRDFEQLVVYPGFFLWKVLNGLAENLLQYEISQYELTLDDHLYALWIKSIDFHHDSFSKFMLSMLVHTGAFESLCKAPIGKRISGMICHPHWEHSGLVDIAEKTENTTIKDLLCKHGANTLEPPPIKTPIPRRPTPRVSTFFEEDFIVKRRPRAQSYADLSEAFGGVDSSF